MIKLSVYDQRNFIDFNFIQAFALFKINYILFDDSLTTISKKLPI